MVAGAGTARACTSSEYRAMNHDSVHQTYPSWPGQEIAKEVAIHHIRGCTVPDEDLAMDVRVEFPGLRPAGTIYWQGETFPAYEAAPDSPLIIFYWIQALPLYPPLTPLEVGAAMPIVRTSTGTLPANVQFNSGVAFFTRSDDRRLRSFEIGGGSMHVNAGAYPSVSGTFPLHLKMVFPATTCPLDDAAETLQDVQVAELTTPGSTAKEKVVALRMNCGVDAPRARMMLSDAADASNTGSLLTPSAGSDAKGVRVQMLRNGSEVQFGQQWDFDPGTGGVHDHAFTARYFRTGDALQPGLIRAEAVLNVDYW